MAITFPTVFQSAIATDAAATAAGYLTPTRYNQGVSVAGLGTDQVLFSTGATALSQSANLLFSDTAFNGAPGLTVGSGTTTSVGWKLGYANASGYSMLWPGAVTPGATNYILEGSAAEIYLNAPSTSINFRIGNTALAILAPTSFIPSPTATVDLGSSGSRWKGLFLSGACTAASYTVGAAAGASGTGTVVSQLTVVNGIVTSCTIA